MGFTEQHKQFRGTLDQAGTELLDGVMIAVALFIVFGRDLNQRTVFMFKSGAFIKWAINMQSVLIIYGFSDALLLSWTVTFKTLGLVFHFLLSTS